LKLQNPRITTTDNTSDAILGLAMKAKPIKIDPQEISKTRHNSIPFQVKYAPAFIAKYAAAIGTWYERPGTNSHVAGLEKRIIESRTVFCNLVRGIFRIRDNNSSQIRKRKKVPDAISKRDLSGGDA
jgi:hypothetical protein